MSLVNCTFCGMPQTRRGSATDRAVDLFESFPDDWWTITELADRVGVSESTAYTVVSRLAKVLESRPLPGQPTPNAGGPHRRSGIGPTQRRQYRWAR